MATLIAQSGFSGKIGGNATIYGTVDPQTVAIIDQPGTVTFDGSFNRGGDVIVFSKSASEYQISKSGSSVIIADADTTVIIPVGTASNILQFADGSRTLKYDNAVKLSNQTVESSKAQITATGTTNTPLLADSASFPSTVIASSERVYLSGWLNVFGSNSVENVSIVDGSNKITLDASFNRGGDTLTFDKAAAMFDVSRPNPSSIQFRSGSSLVTVPLGTTGLSVKFGNDERTLLYKDGEALLGLQKLSVGFASVTPKSIGITGNVTAAALKTAVLTKAYQVYSISTSEVIPSYTYAGKIYPEDLVGIFPQASIAVDFFKDGRPELVIPLTKAYGTPNYAAMPYLYLSNTTGKLEYIAAENAAMPSVFGARRAEPINVDGSNSAFFVAHNVSGQYADPNAYGTAVLLSASAGSVVYRKDLLPRLTLGSQLSDYGTDAHAMAVGDINGDGRDDIVVGNWSSGSGFAPIFLLQQSDGNFLVQRSDFLDKLNNVPLLNQNVGGQYRYNFWTDAHFADLNGDGYDDLIIGFAQGSTYNFLFMNKGGTFNFDERINLPAPIYGVDNDLHMVTKTADFDGDGDLDVVIVHSRYEPYYGGNYLQFLRNDGGKLIDITTSALPQKESEIFAERLAWSSDLFIEDVNHDGLLDIIFGKFNGQITLFVNKGGNAFNPVDAVLPFPFNGRLVGFDDFNGDGSFEAVYFEYGGDAKTHVYDINVYNVTFG